MINITFILLENTKFENRFYKKFTLYTEKIRNTNMRIYEHYAEKGILKILSVDKL